MFNSISGALLCFLAIGVSQAGVPPSHSSGPDSNPDGLTLVTLLGRTDHPVLVDAEILVSAGDQSISTSTNQEGRFSATLNCDDPQALVIVKAFGAGSQSEMGGARLVHSCSEILSNRTIEGDYPVGPINPLSTGLYLIAGQTLGVFGSADTDWTLDALSPHRFSMQFDKLGRIATVIRLFSLPEFDAPTGVETVWDLLQSPQLINSASSLNSGLLEEPQIEAGFNAFWQDPELFRPVGTLSWPGTIGLSCARLMVSNCAEVLAANTDGSSVYQSFFGSVPAVVRRGAQFDRLFSDRFDGQRPAARFLRASGASGQPLVSTSTTYSVGGQSYPAQRETVWQDFYSVDASEFIRAVATVAQYRITFSENPELNDVFLDRERPKFRAAYFDTNDLPNWTSPTDGDQWVMTFNVDPESPMDTGGMYSMDIVTFSGNGTAFSARQDTTWNWSIEGSVLTLDHASLPTHQYRLLRDNASLSFPHQAVMLETLTSEGELIVTTEESIGISEPQQFELADVPGRYVSGLDIDDFYPTASTWDSGRFFTFVLRADGTGWSGYTLDPSGPEPHDALAVSWELQANGELVITRDFGSGLQYRSWRPVHRAHTDVLYVFEVGPSSVVSEPDFEIPFTTGRLNYYRKLPL